MSNGAGDTEEHDRWFAWISGGAGGLGEAFAEELLRYGAGGIALVDRDEERGVAVLERLRGIARENDRNVLLLFFNIDVCDSTAVERSLFTCAEKFSGRLNLVVNNHGVPSASSTQKMFDVNALSVISTTRLAFRLMSGLNGGAIVNVSSAAGIFPIYDAQDYTAAKHAVVGFTRCYAMERKVRVNALCPGFVDTKFLDSQRNSNSSNVINAVGIMSPAEVARAMLTLAKLKDSGQVLYLSKKTGSYYPYDDQALRWQKKAKRNARERTENEIARAKL